MASANKHQMSDPFRNVPIPAGGLKRWTQQTVATVLTSDSQKAMNRNAATKVRLELVKHESGQFAASRFQVCQERRPVLLDRSIEQSRFGTMARVRACTRGRMGVTARCWFRGKHQQELSEMERR